jgi:hypothetical protein
VSPGIIRKFKKALSNKKLTGIYKIAQESDTKAFLKTKKSDKNLSPKKVDEDD